MRHTILSKKFIFIFKMHVYKSVDYSSLHVHGSVKGILVTAVEDTKPKYIYDMIYVTAIG
jgi:hypothetical protein